VREARWCLSDLCEQLLLFVRERASSQMLNLLSPREPAPLPDEEPLDGLPASLVEALGGALGDIAHDEQALERATSLATGSRSATFSPLLLRSKGCIGYRWTRVWAFTSEGKFHLFATSSAATALRQLQVQQCQCEVGERDTCQAGLYCFRLVHAEGAVTFCAYSSKALTLWLQALQAAGVRYEEPKLDITGISSLFDLQAELLDGTAADLARFKGCVCLVVNVASK